MDPEMQGNCLMAPPPMQTYHGNLYHMLDARATYIMKLPAVVSARALYYILSTPADVLSLYL